MSQAGTIIRTNVGAKGRVVIPTEIRNALGLKEGSAIEFRLDEHGAHISTLRSRILRAQARARLYLDPKVSLADELNAERREAAKHE